jgi:hypothetical protein
MVTLKRWKFGRSSEQINGTQISLLEVTLDADIAAIEQELKALTPVAKTDAQPRQQPKRSALPAGLARVDIHHEPDSTTCGCGCQLKRIGQDVSEKLDYVLGGFTVEQHIRGKWACAQCETLIQAPVPAQIIDKGIATAGLLAQVSGGQVQRPFAAVPSGAELVWRCRASPWGSVWAFVACNCSHWWMHSKGQSSSTQSFMQMRRRCRCSNPERRIPTALIFGLMRREHLKI